MKRLDEQNQEDEYRGLFSVHAVEHVRENQPGYVIRYGDGYIGWMPKGTFERYYFKQARYMQNEKESS